MKTTRRTFLAGGAAALSFGLTTRMVHAEVQLGDMRLDVVSDGSLTLPANLIFEPMPKDELAPIISKYHFSPKVLTPPCNVTLMRSGERTVLFDVGSGPDFTPTAGELLQSLDQLGVAPEDVTDVLFTHAHPDHLWGVLDDFDDPLFANATHYMGKTEWDYWMDPDTVDTIGQARVPFAVGAKRRLEIMQDQMDFFDDGQEILPGVAARGTFGHTPGHMSFEVRQGSESVMILGDCIGNDHVAFEKPGWKSGSDQDLDKAVETRVRLMDQLAHEKPRIIGYHLAHGGIGYVDRTSTGYVFVPEDS